MERNGKEHLLHKTAFTAAIIEKKIQPVFLGNQQMTASYPVIFSLLELDTHGKIKRVLLIGGKIVALLALLYLFICSLSFLTSAFRLLSGVKTGENLPYIQYSISICKMKLTASQICRH